MVANENSGERKIKRFKGSDPSSFFLRSPAARRTDPLTEGLEQAKPLTETNLGVARALFESGALHLGENFHIKQTGMPIGNFELSP